MSDYTCARPFFRADTQISMEFLLISVQLFFLFFFIILEGKNANLYVVVFLHTHIRTRTITWLALDQLRDLAPVGMPLSS